jgi:hypothetical protein
MWSLAFIGFILMYKVKSNNCTIAPTLKKYYKIKCTIRLAWYNCIFAGNGFVHTNKAAFTERNFIGMAIKIRL